MKQPVIKYCGNKSFEDLAVVANSNANYVGFIFAPSKRQVDPFQVMEWLKKIEIKGKQLVGVFVNAELSDIEAVISLVPLSVIQCHGTESVTNLMKVKEKTKLEVWKVIHHAENALESMKTYAGVADGYVIDTKVKGVWGGSGVTFDWNYIPHYQEEAQSQGVACLIAGGILPTNIERLLDYEIDGFDISSGIERNGAKDVTLISTIEEWVRKI